MGGCCNAKDQHEFIVFSDHYLNIVPDQPLINPQKELIADIAPITEEEKIFYTNAPFIRSTNDYINVLYLLKIIGSSFKITRF